MPPREAMGTEVAGDDARFMARTEPTLLCAPAPGLPGAESEDALPRLLDVRRGELCRRVARRFSSDAVRASTFCAIACLPSLNGD